MERPVHPVLRPGNRGTQGKKTTTEGPGTCHGAWSLTLRRVPMTAAIRHHTGGASAQNKSAMLLVDMKAGRLLAA